MGAFRRAAAIYRKAQLGIDLNQSHDAFFVQNLTAIRAEQQELLAIYRPAGFGTASVLLTRRPSSWSSREGKSTDHSAEKSWQ